MSQSLLELAHRLTQEGKPFVLATVVWCERPTSAKPGAQALIEADGSMTGWIGGSCSQPIVVREAVRALQAGDEPYLLHLGATDTATARHHVRFFPMTCASGGALEIYIEPHIPYPQLILIGNSPILFALHQLASTLAFTVIQLDHADLSQIKLDSRTFIVIATHGEYDEDALEQALRSPARYVGLVASRRRADSCRAYLRAAGMEEQRIARLHAPAGLDIGAVTPEEIAASILAELVQVNRRTSPPKDERQTGTSDVRKVADLLVVAPEKAMDSDTALDPVCGMIVETAHARHRSTYDGRVFYFCCPACKRLFESDPQAYLVQKGK
jgi:xanthine dehydrogenase accessory factor